MTTDSADISTVAATVPPTVSSTGQFACHSAASNGGGATAPPPDPPANIQAASMFRSIRSPTRTPPSSMTGRVAGCLIRAVEPHSRPAQPTVTAKGKKAPGRAKSPSVANVSGTSVAMRTAPVIISQPDAPRKPATIG
jgi:hypothetical protein